MHVHHGPMQLLHGLRRWFCASDVEVPDAKYLDIILYSRQQLLKEYEAMPKDKRRQLPDAPWGIISVKAQDEDHETPMQVMGCSRPICMRQGPTETLMDSILYCSPSPSCATAWAWKRAAAGCRWTGPHTRPP